MKRMIIFFIFFLAAIQMNSQNNDTFEFRNDTTMLYRLPVLADDIKYNNKTRKISSFKKNINGVNFALSISSPDSTSILISELSPISNGSFTYYSTDSSGVSDSGVVIFSKIKMEADIYPGDVNGDSVCNHLDIIPACALMNTYGNPRHNIDTSSSFLPKKAGNWFLNAGNINGKHADINGDGEINNLDIDLIQANFGLSRGVYKPTLSSISGSTLLEVDKNSPDTFLLNKDSIKIKLPLKITTTNLLNVYGIGYTLSVKSQNTLNGQDTFYSNYEYIENLNFLSSSSNNKISLKYIQNKQKSNFVVSKIDKVNSSLGGGSHELGVVEVVVDVILGAIVSKDDVKRIKIELSDVVLADNNNSLIPISPISKNIYLQKDFNANIRNETQNIISVYPNPIQSQIIIEKKSINDDDISIYNALGMKIYEVKLTNRQTMISNINWNSGIYYLKVESTGQIVKLIKQ